MTRDYLDNIPVYVGALLFAGLLMLMAFLLSGPTFGNELPDMPTPKPQHSFFDKWNKLEFASSGTLAAFDAGQTCHNLATGGHEDKLPVKSCGTMVAFTLAEQAGAWSLAWVLHKTGHHKLERIPALYLIGANSYAIAYSHKHGAF